MLPSWIQISELQSARQSSGLFWCDLLGGGTETSFKWMRGNNKLSLESKLDWSVNIDAVYRKSQSRLFFLRRLRSLDVCGEMLHMFYRSVVASTIFYAAIC